MKVYISGITGTGMGPLALMAKKAGIEVFGSDLKKGAIYDELVKAGIEVFIGEQDGEFLKSNLSELDWFVYTSALTDTHAELVVAREAGVKCTKRDEFTAFLVDELGLKMVAVAGTHGKTTTTAMIVWLALKLGLPVSYIVGTTLRFAPSGAYHEGDEFFVYEADEYDRNFLKFYPWLSVITSVSYDHPDIYKTREEYEEAFLKFISQSDQVIDGRDAWEFGADKIKLAGEVRREDARLAIGAIGMMISAMGESGKAGDTVSLEKLIALVEEFPGVGRRFERLADGIYTDYAHHPEEIAATVDVALDEMELRGYKGVAVVYQPHQNTRQHEVMQGYFDAFVGVDRLFWLPTFLTRENPALAVLSPEDLMMELSNPEIAEAAELSDELFDEIIRLRDAGYLVVMMTAGPADGWLREKIAEKKL